MSNQNNNNEPPINPNSQEEQNPTQILTNLSENEETNNNQLSLNQPSREASDYGLGLAGQLSQRNLNIDRLDIKVNGQSVFKMNDGELEKSTINNEQAELIKKALKDPAALKGTVKITQGSQVLLHVKNGRVLVDKARLTEQSAQVEVTSQKGLYDKYSQNVNSQGLQKTKEVAQNALKDGMDKKDVVNLLQNHDAASQDLLKQSGEEKGTQALNKIVDLEVTKLQSHQQQSSQKEPELATSKGRSR